MLNEKINNSPKKHIILFVLGSLFAFITFWVMTYIPAPYFYFGECHYPDIHEENIGNIIVDTILPICIIFVCIYEEIKIFQNEETLKVKPFLYFIFAAVLFILYVGLEIILGVVVNPFNKQARMEWAFFGAIPVAIVSIFIMLKNGIKGIKHQKEKNKQ